MDLRSKSIKGLGVENLERYSDRLDRGETLRYFSGVGRFAFMRCLPDAPAYLHVSLYGERVIYTPGDTAIDALAMRYLSAADSQTHFEGRQNERIDRIQSSLPEAGYFEAWLTGFRRAHDDYKAGRLKPPFNL